VAAPRRRKEEEKETSAVAQKKFVDHMASMKSSK